MSQSETLRIYDPQEDSVSPELKVYSPPAPDSPLEERYGYKKEPLEVRATLPEPVIYDCTHSYAVIGGNDQSYAWSISISNTPEGSIAKFLNWCRMRRGRKTWDAWMSQGFHVEKLSITSEMV